MGRGECRKPTRFFFPSPPPPQVTYTIAYPATLATQKDMLVYVVGWEGELGERGEPGGG